MPELTKPTDDVQRLERLDARLRWVMSTEQGRAAAWYILDELGGLFSPSHTGELAGTAYREGQRAVAIRLMEDLKRASPGGYVAMLRERLELANPHDK